MMNKRKNFMVTLHNYKFPSSINFHFYIYIDITFKDASLNFHVWFISWLNLTKKQVYNITNSINVQQTILQEF